jgi:hypothetical protein
MGPDHILHRRVGIRCPARGMNCAFFDPEARAHIKSGRPNLQVPAGYCRYHPEGDIQVRTSTSYNIDPRNFWFRHLHCELKWSVWAMGIQKGGQISVAAVRKRTERVRLAYFRRS